MADTPNQTEITTATGMTDALKAAGRYVYAIVTVGSLGMGAIASGNPDVIYNFWVDNVGQVVTALFGLSGLGVAGYGVWRTYRRGQKLVDVEPFVPDAMLTNTNKDASK